MAVLLAGLPVEVPGVTVNRLCASGLEAVNQAARAVRVGDAHLVLAGGVESMTRAPVVTLQPERGFPPGEPESARTTSGWRFVQPAMSDAPEGMGETTENSSQINDGAACVVVASERAAERLGRGPLARVVATGGAGVDPAFMGIAPVPASQRALERASLGVDDLDMVEINEAFAAQVLPSMRLLGVPHEKL